jgi:RimJ/RimL family protein N-acetyltransferase
VNHSDRAALPYGLTIRPLAAADRGSLAELPGRVSPQSAISRFHGAVSRLSEPFLDQLLDLREGQREAVIALDGREIVGVARFARDAEDADTAEVAVLVADEWQHRGVAHQMLRPLIARAVSAGITRLRADILAENTAARRLFAEVGPTLRESVVNGHVVVTIDLSTTVERP